MFAVSKKLIPASSACLISGRLSSSGSDQTGWPRSGVPKLMAPMAMGETSSPLLPSLMKRIGSPEEGKESKRRTLRIVPEPYRRVLRNANAAAVPGDAVPESVNEPSRADAIKNRDRILRVAHDAF